MSNELNLMEVIIELEASFLMGLVESLGWIQSVGKKQCRSLYRRVRAAMKKAVRNGSKPHAKFQYDPYSYALNFDDGFHGDERDFQQPEFQECPERTIWVYVVLAN
ncbi:hypothetical protein Pfo_023323 [Paulownia fortunei]|nr:hypothetical protein Pfo_023323 [Paulownia fortunei]